MSDHGGVIDPETTHNFSRYCVENPHITWVMLIGTVVWGVYGYTHMPQRKDPEIPVKQAMVVTPWPGASAERIEDLVTRTIEQTIATNSNVSRIESVSRSNVSVVTFTLSEDLRATGQILDDIGGRLAAIRNLPDGAGPVDYVRDFGDTATLMLTIASPKADANELDLRAASIRRAIQSTRDGAQGNRVSLVYCFPPNTDRRLIRLGGLQLVSYIQARGEARDLRILEGSGFLGIDADTQSSDAQILGMLAEFMRSKYRESELPLDMWQPFVVRDPASTRAGLATVPGDKYTYRELEDFTEAIEKALLATGRTPDGTPLVGKVSRSGTLPERVYLFYSQERLASYGVKTGQLSQVLSARNVTLAGGEVDAGTKTVSINASGEFASEKEIGDVAVGVP